VPELINTEMFWLLFVKSKGQIYYCELRNSFIGMEDSVTQLYLYNRIGQLKVRNSCFTLCRGGELHASLSHW
jgi:hypothetical protein